MINQQPFDVKVSISSEFCDENGTEIRFEVGVKHEMEEVKFKYFPFNTGILLLDTRGEILNPNTFYCLGDMEDSDYSEGADECEIGFYLSCPKLLKLGGKFLFTFINEEEEVVDLVIDIADDHTVKTEFVDASKMA